MNQHFAVAVVICFFLCWSPYHAQRLLFSYLTLTGRWNGVLVKVHHYLYWSSGIKGVILIGCQLLGVNGVKTQHLFHRSGVLPELLRQPSRLLRHVETGTHTRWQFGLAPLAPLNFQRVHLRRIWVEGLKLDYGPTLQWPLQC